MPDSTTTRLKAIIETTSLEVSEVFVPDPFSPSKLPPTPEYSVTQKGSGDLARTLSKRDAETLVEITKEAPFAARKALECMGILREARKLLKSDCRSCEDQGNEFICSGCKTDECLRRIAAALGEKVTPDDQLD